MNTVNQATELILEVQVLDFLIFMVPIKFYTYKQWIHCIFITTIIYITLEMCLKILKEMVKCGKAFPACPYIKMEEVH